MNIIFKHLSLSIVTVSLLASMNTQCMLIKSLTMKPYQQKLFASTTSSIQNNWYKNVLEGAKKTMQNNDPQVKCYAFDILKAFVKRNMAIKDAMEIITIESECSNKNVRIASFDLLEIIVKTDNQELVAPAIEIVQKKIKCEDRAVHDKATNILLYLIEKNQALEIASDLANTCMANNGQYIRENGLKIYSALLNKGLANSEAMDLVHRSFTCEKKTLNINREVLQLLSLLYNKDRCLVKWAVEYATIGRAIGAGNSHSASSVYDAAALLFDDILKTIKQSDETKS